MGDAFAPDRQRTRVATPQRMEVALSGHVEMELSAADRGVGHRAGGAVVGEDLVLGVAVVPGVGEGLGRIVADRSGGGGGGVGRGKRDHRCCEQREGACRQERAAEACPLGQS